LIALFGQAMPTFRLCFLMILLFGVNLGWLPVSGSATPAHFIMPAIALGYFAMPAFTRITRAGMFEIMQSDYIRTARAKGLRPRPIVLKHALRNALAPVVSVAAVRLGFMLGGLVVIETIFALHGVGYLAWEAISQNDYPVVQAILYAENQWKSRTLHPDMPARTGLRTSLPPLKTENRHTGCTATTGTGLTPGSVPKLQTRSDRGQPVEAPHLGR